MKIPIKKQSYPLYYSLFSPDNFDLANPKYATITSDKVVKTIENSPSFVKTFRGYHALSLRITTKSSHDFILSYELKPQKSSQVLIKFGVLVLSILSALLLIINFTVGKDDFQQIFDKNIEIGLFIIGASLLPQLHSDVIIRRELIAYYMIPIILGGAILFV